MARAPVPPVTAICDAGHEALTEGVRETPHHLPHALMMDLEWVAKEGDETKKKNHIMLCCGL